MGKKKHPPWIWKNKVSVLYPSRLKVRKVSKKQKQRAVLVFLLDFFAIPTIFCFGSLNERISCGKNEKESSMSSLSKCLRFEMLHAVRSTVFPVSGGNKRERGTLGGEILAFQKCWHRKLL